MDMKVKSKNYRSQSLIRAIKVLLVKSVEEKGYNFIGSDELTYMNLT